MPKYSTVQAYSDNSSNVQTVSYEQASGTATAKAGPGEFLFACLFVCLFVCLFFVCPSTRSVLHTRDLVGQYNAAVVVILLNSYPQMYNF